MRWGLPCQVVGLVCRFCSNHWFFEEMDVACHEKKDICLQNDILRSSDTNKVPLNEVVQYAVHVAWQDSRSFVSWASIS